MIGKFSAGSICIDVYNEKITMSDVEVCPKSMGAALADLLRDGILTREFVDGERLPELPLCEKYGVSRIPLREAFQILASEGLIVSTANRGARVRILTPRDIEQIFHLRLILETDLAEASVAGLTNQHVGEAIVAAELRPNCSAAQERSHETMSS